MTRAETAVALVYAADTLHFHRHKNRLSPKAKGLLTRAESDFSVCCRHILHSYTEILAKSKSEKRLLTRAETAVALVCAADTHCISTDTKIG